MLSTGQLSQASLPEVLISKTWSAYSGGASDEEHIMQRLGTLPQSQGGFGGPMNVTVNLLWLSKDCIGIKKNNNCRVFKSNP